MLKPSPKLSAIIITHNEEANVTRAISSVKFTGEVIVVDSESSDRTVEIAQSLGAKVFIRAWEGYGPQKNFGASQASGEWLLYIDADEEITSELAQEIRTIIQKPEKDFFWLKIETVFLKRPMKYIYGHNARLFKKSAGAWSNEKVHERVQTHSGQVIHLNDNLSGLLKNSLLHHSHETISSYLESMRKYTTLDAQQMARENKHRSGRKVTSVWWLPYYLAKRQFLKLYFYKKGFLDGYAGVMWSLLSAYYEYTMAKKYLALCA